jgi:riboflavin biosynthesis pyrimidine reductase
VLHRLSDGAPRSARDLVDGLGLLRPPEPGRRPRVVGSMIASIDGRAAVQGRSVGLGHPADRALLRELRTGVDAILVGTTTIGAERYANLLDPEQRAHRVVRGMDEHPLVATVSRDLRLPLGAPIFAEPETRLLAFTESAAPAPRVAARLEVHRFAPGRLTLQAALNELAARGTRGVLCEGGPTLLRRLVAEDCLDDLLLTVSPLLAAGDAPAILEGPGLGEPARLALREVHRADDHLFLHYGARR